MTDKERKNFTTKVQLEVFTEQGGLCGKCGKSLMYGYHAHHKDGDHSNNDKENCQLLCRACHGGEQYKTLQSQKEATIVEIDSIIKKGADGGLAGASIDKLLDAVKLKLSLQGQVYDDPATEAPIEQRMRDYQAMMEYGIDKYASGVTKGIDLGVEIAQGKKKV